MMRADAGLHTDQARRQVGEPRFHLAAWPLLPQHDGTVAIMTHDVERVFADIDPDHGDLCGEFLRHGVLLVLSAPCQLLVLAGAEHGRTIPVAEVRSTAAWRQLLMLQNRRLLASVVVLAKAARPNCVSNAPRSP